MYTDNKRRDRKNGPVDQKRGEQAGMLDVTEVGSVTALNLSLIGKVRKPRFPIRLVAVEF